jgi:exodeoxyribonuclease-1
VTGIKPQLAKAKGVCEAQFIARIHMEMALQNTCTLGYNNLRFDDEVTQKTSALVEIIVFMF